MASVDQIVSILDTNKKKKSIYIIVMDSCHELGDNIAERLSGISRQIEIKHYKFGNNEINTFPSESVRKKDVFIIASGSNIDGSVNDNLTALYSMIRSCRDGSAKYITVICSYFPYSRSDKKDQSRMTIMAKLTCDFIKMAGANRLITVDLHASQIQGFFDGPFDNLYAIQPLITAIKKDYNNIENMIVVSPDAGGEKRSHSWANKLGVLDTFFTKHRDHQKISTIARQELVHQIDFVDKIIILVDDIGDTLGTLNGAAKILKEKGAKKIIAVVTHGIFSGKAFDNLNSGFIDTMYVTNTLPQVHNRVMSEKIRIVDISELLSKAVHNCIYAESVSELFQ